MGQPDKKQLNIFAKLLMPELYEIQTRFNNWEKAIQDLVKKSTMKKDDSPKDKANIDDEVQHPMEQSSS